ncbi:sigma-70 family RNA polymerase sigma factor [Marinomonas sp. M1K-6]|uniref:Sigma-70 family RNA polymerase sigma factor n=1 Tax=Marinomonas profundi TaxID=2726122 RepID=A0A847R1A0_9GAMM|nr:sigma-70 family RNA polymerase sigma factor [Marinomonas profundi]NLQ17455.1 sigma-70 family RNA polymerase sigma factor [Marinomonas profundi]UDV01978.1 sigma-70 family RNA polymerase sigma factor [Marinomonas profundi]
MPHNADPRAQQSAMHALYSDNHHWLYTWIRKRLDNQFDAADLTQDTFLRIHSRQDVEQITEPRAYIVTVAKGIISHFYRRQSLEDKYLEYLSLFPEPVTRSQEQQQIILQTLEQIDALLNELPPHVKSVFLLSQIEGKKYQAIADDMNLSLISVKRYMKQAYVQCLSLMEDDFFE